MGWFKKKEIDAPPPLDVPEPIDISNEPLKELGELDIPPIGLSDNESNKDVELKLSDMDVPLPPPDMEEKGSMDLPPVPQSSDDEQNQELLFPSLDETNDSKTDFNTNSTVEGQPAEEVTTLPFEHVGDYPDEQELKETMTVPKPRHKAHTIPNYDALLVQAKTAPHIKPNKKYFISMTEYKEIFEDVSSINSLCGNEVDTVLRIKAIQDEKSARYDRYQQELEQMNSLLGKLDTIIFTLEKAEK